MNKTTGTSRLKPNNCNNCFGSAMLFSKYCRTDKGTPAYVCSDPKRAALEHALKVGMIGTNMDSFASYCLSKQGKMGINVGGYRFRFNGCARNGKIRWRCSRGPWCKAALHTYRGRIVYIQSLHNCGPKPPVTSNPSSRVE